MADGMVSADPELISALRALSNPVRLQLLLWLREPERHFALEGAIADPGEVGVCVSHIQARVGLAQSTVSAYMAELQRAGLVQATRVGKWTHYKRDEQRIGELVAVLGETLLRLGDRPVLSPPSRRGARRDPARRSLRA
jgi:ArsR family transcriptional regulator